MWALKDRRSLVASFSSFFINDKGKFIERVNGSDFSSAIGLILLMGVDN